jgi:hypothetical protein
MEGDGWGVEEPWRMTGEGTWKWLEGGGGMEESWRMEVWDMEEGDIATRDHTKTHHWI